ncbi:MAG: insulinase family protein [Gammaproteobacteria bacterium]|nr:insulinase family protein [Gammaproteobacteria bacterium]
MRHFYKLNPYTFKLGQFGGLVFILALFLSLPAKAASFEKTYANGLKLIVREDHRAPVAVSQIWYRVGSSYEHTGITGISHALEHLMFKATSNTASGEFSRLVAESGGRDNAFTGQHYTTYYQQVASDRLELCIRLEADRMKNLLFDEGEFKREIEVIKEERNLRIDSNPLSQFYERFLTTVYLRSPLRNPVIGWPEDIAQLQIKDTEDWYRRWYSPDNATLVVVGDVSFDAVDEWVKKYFLDIESSPREKPRSAPEIRQNGMKLLQGYGDTSSPYLIMAYQAPVINTLDNLSDAFALDVLSGILDGGGSARFSRYLQRGDELALSASAGYDPFDRLQGLFTITAMPKPGITLEVLQAAIEKQIQSLKTEKVSDTELDRVKAQVVSGRIYDQDSMFNMAMQIGMLESAGIDWRLIEQYVDHIQRVNAGDVLRVANRYLNQTSLTLGKFWPESEKP